MNSYINSYQIERIAADMKLARYLLTMADNRGLTHGEKHYMIQTALKLLAKATDDLLGYQHPSSAQDVTQIELSDIPF